MRRVAAFARARAGATAVEFALVAIPLLMLLMGTLELCLIFVANTGLQNATFAAARQIRVGEIMAPGLAQTSSSGVQLDLADFKARLCRAMPLLGAMNCAANLYVDVREIPAFAGGMAASPFSGSTLQTGDFCYYSGASGSIVEVRAYYTWSVFTPLILSALVNTRTVLGDGGDAHQGAWFALSSHEVFRNEPGAMTANTGASC